MKSKIKKMIKIIIIMIKIIIRRVWIILYTSQSGIRNVVMHMTLEVITFIITASIEREYFWCLRCLVEEDEKLCLKVVSLLNISKNTISKVGLLYSSEPLVDSSAVVVLWRKYELMLQLLTEFDENRLNKGMFSFVFGIEQGDSYRTTYYYRNVAYDVSPNTDR